MRELRVIEACVDILHTPFASGNFDFSKINQDMAITQICKLSYLCLGKIVENYELNEKFASQWIGLFLKQVLETTTKN